MFNDTKQLQRGTRSLRVRPDCIDRVKAAVKQKGYYRQRDLAEELEISLATISNFLNGKPTDFAFFDEISTKLGFNWRSISLEGAAIASTASSLALETKVVDLEETSTFTYIERLQLEQACYKALMQVGALVRIQAPRQMGKTSLMKQVKQQLDKNGIRTAYVSLHMAEQRGFEDLSCLLKWFCLSVGKSLGLPNRLQELWDEDYSTPKVNCADYFEQCFLSQSDTPLVVFLDDLELIFPHAKVASEGLGLLRAWHEKAKTDPYWKQFRIFLSYASEIQIELNFNESPFNVGMPIELPELTLAEVQLLAQRHNLVWIEPEVKQLMDLVGGHPYLVERAFAYLQQCPEYSLVNLLQTANLDSGIYGNHLRWLARIVQQTQTLHEYLEMITQSDQPTMLGNTQAWQLYRLGLVHWQNNQVQMRNRLYREYFSQQLRG